MDEFKEENAILLTIASLNWAVSTKFAVLSNVFIESLIECE